MQLNDNIYFGFTRTSTCIHVVPFWGRIGMFRIFNGVFCDLTIPSHQVIACLILKQINQHKTIKGNQNELKQQNMI